MKIGYLIFTCSILAYANGLFAQAPQKSFIRDNVEASLYGEALIETGRYGDIPTTLTRFEGGWLLWGTNFMSTSIGISHAGFGASPQKDGSMKNYDTAFYGPVFKLIFPFAGRFSTALALFYGNGEVSYDRPAETPTNTVATLQLFEANLQLNYRFSDYTSVMLSAGSCRHREDIYDTYPIGDETYHLKRKAIRRTTPVYAMGFRVASF